jgi:hypothetical protein
MCRVSGANVNQLIIAESVLQEDEAQLSTVTSRSTTIQSHMLFFCLEGISKPVCVTNTSTKRKRVSWIYADSLAWCVANISGTQKIARTSVGNALRGVPRIIVALASGTESAAYSFVGEITHSRVWPIYLAWSKNA